MGVDAPSGPQPSVAVLIDELRQLARASRRPFEAATLRWAADELVDCHGRAGTARLADANSEGPEQEADRQ